MYVQSEITIVNNGINLYNLVSPNMGFPSLKKPNCTATTANSAIIKNNIDDTIIVTKLKFK
jgi:hypothetical protein